MKDPSASWTWHQLLALVKADLLAEPSDRNDPAWAELAERIRRLARLASLSADSSPAAAEDLAQELLLELQTTALIDQVAAAESPSAYLMTTLRNRGLDQVRRELRKEKALIRFRPLPTPDRDPEDDDDDLYEALGMHLRKLNREERGLLRQRFWQGLSIREIANRRREPYSRVAVRLFRLIRRLAQELGNKVN